MTAHSPLGGSEIVEQKDQQQRSDRGRQECEVEPSNKAEVRVARISLVNLSFKREHPNAMLPRAAVALPHRCERKVGRWRVGEVESVVGGAPPILLAFEGISSVGCIFFDQSGDCFALLAHLGNAERHRNNRKDEGQQ